VLILLDNAHDEEQVRPLLPGTPGCAVVVTSRSYLGALVVEEGARSMDLGVFSDADAQRYVRSRLGKARVDAEPGAASEIIEVCGGLPLALAICAAWVQRSPAFTLGAVAAEIRRRAGLDAFTGVTSGRDVRAVFTWSYRQLSPDAAELFRRLGGHPGNDVAPSTAVSIAGRGRGVTIDLLAELGNAQLLNERRPGRYGAHDLVRAYAAELGDATERQETARRVVDHYLHSLMAAATAVLPNRPPVDADPPAPGVAPWLPAGKADAAAWFAAEHDNLRGALDLAEQEGLDSCVWLFGWCLNAFPEQSGGWDEIVSVGTRALAAAQRQGATWWLAYLNTGLVRGNGVLGNYDEAYRYYAMAATVGRELNDPLRTAKAVIGMAFTLVDRGGWPSGENIERAAELADEARALCEPVANDAAPGTLDSIHAQELLGSSFVYSALLLFHRTGDLAATVAELQRGIDLQREIGNWLGEHQLWYVLASVQEQSGDGGSALAAYEQALGLRPDETWISVETLVSLAELQARLGRPEASARTAARAWELMTGVYHAFAERQRARLDALASRPGTSR